MAHLSFARLLKFHDYFAQNFNDESTLAEGALKQSDGVPI